MTLFTVVSAGIAFISATIGMYVASRAWVEYYRVHNRVETVEDRIQSLHGKVHREKRTTRDEIRDAVDQYLATLDFETGGGAAMGDEMMQMMLAQGMQGMLGSAAAEPAPEDDRSGDDHSLNILGQGGKNGSRNE